MSVPNDSDDATADSPTPDPDDSPSEDSQSSGGQSTTADSTPNDPSADESTTDSESRLLADQPFCRVFRGPTSHRVQYTGAESRPATAIDCEHNVRSRAADTRSADWVSADRRTAGDRAIATLLAHRFAALERTLDAVRATCWRGETPEAETVRQLRTQLVDLQVAVEEHLARACPETEPWESACEHIHRARLGELTNDRRHGGANERVETSRKE